MGYPTGSEEEPASVHTPVPGSRLLEAGEHVLVIDHKGRRYLVRLRADGSFHTHAGILSHDLIIGMQCACQSRK